jgi:hypothetical protein
MVDQHLRLNEEALNWEPAEVTVPSVPAIPPGADPMSVMLAAIAPEIATAVTEGVAEALAREERFSANVTGARTSYQNTDGAAHQQIQGAGELAEPDSVAGWSRVNERGGRGGAAGGSDGPPDRHADADGAAGCADTNAIGGQGGVDSAGNHAGCAERDAAGRSNGRRRRGKDRPRVGSTGRRVNGRGEARGIRRRGTGGEGSFARC